MSEKQQIGYIVKKWLVEGAVIVPATTLACGLFIPVMMVGCKTKPGKIIAASIGAVGGCCAGLAAGWKTSDIIFERICPDEYHEMKDDGFM